MKFRLIAILLLIACAFAACDQPDKNGRRRRSASLLDTTSCCVQGLLPYGAQLLMASGIAGISAMSIVPWLFYPFFLSLTVIATIVCRKRQK